MNLADYITSISVLISAIAFVVGVNAWKREYIGRRRIELAENVLALFYEAQDAIREIRSPFGYYGEGATRTHSENETEEETRRLDNAFVVFERYKKKEKLFAELHSLRYRFRATFGTNSSEPFLELNIIIREIFEAARLLGTIYWKRIGNSMMSEEAHQNTLENVRKYEAIIWSHGYKDDEISLRVQRAVEKIEEITKKESLMRISWFNRKTKIDPNNQI